MKIGHVFKIDNIEYCICDIKKIGDREFAYSISGEKEDTKITFFQLVYDDNGVLITEINDDNLISDLLNLFLID